jgi:N-acetylmuramoyl-L-alanine amidase
MIYHLKKIYGKSIIDGGVREAPFWVLVGATMPAVLIEVGYISHPKESRIINSYRYQINIAKAISNGIDAYFRKNF